MEVSKGVSEMVLRLVPASQQAMLESLDVLSEYCRQVEGIGGIH